jgi:transposase InsO family protein
MARLVLRVTHAREFDQLCAELGIEHRLTPPASPRTNGLVERFNGRIEAVLQSHHFRSGERPGDHAAPLCLAHQPATAAVGLGQQVAIAGDEGLAQSQAAAVQKTAIRPSGMGHRSMPT